MRNVTKKMLGAAAIVAIMSAPALAANDRLTVKNSTDVVVFKVDDAGAITFPVANGKGGSLSIASTLTNFGLVSVNGDQTVPSAGVAMQMVPRGTGYNANIKAQVSVFNTDFIADGVNYEALVLRAAGVKYSINATASGTGVIRPIQFQMQNQPKMTLDTTGYVGIGTTTPKSPLAVVGLPTFSSNAAALAGPPALVAGDFYKTATGQVMVVY